MIKEKKYLIIYHKDCIDGTGAAYASFCHFPKEADVVYLAYSYDMEPPWNDLEGREVYLLDYCFSYDTCMSILGNANSLTIIDHHKTTYDAFGVGANSKTNPLTLPNSSKTITLILDMKKSGAVLSWEYFNACQAPELLLYIQDRDLFNWELPNSREINEALCLGEYTYENLQFANKSDLLEEGIACLKVAKSIVKRLEKLSFVTSIDGLRLIACNVPSIFASNVGEALSNYPENLPVIIYSYDGGSWRYSLRSKKGVGVDVEKIAKSLGGGGHKHSAGFSLHFNLFD